MKKVVLVAVALVFLIACTTESPLKIETVKNPKYPFEVAVITNTEYMSDADFMKYVMDYLETSKFWQTKVIIEVKFEEGERLQAGKCILYAFVFWKNVK